ncbi:hypothetical protein [Amycolatopsis dendrobii]|uniref:Uncharacterized protein n=1 Tax=Amycolatopsis dendrobii TaxID=2760662 RepID=A0A7W3Z983_9PSEU|nr:hypothetical protein [Amycolatopsis dendrobii]MBB1152474.1 hypothetical protein [Amycolatopsis dendrobii]
MSVLLEPLDDQQKNLLELVWSLFREKNQFPVYQYVEYMLRQRGYEATEILSSFPSISPDGSQAHYAAVYADPNTGTYLPDNRVCLTIAGLFHARDHLAMEIIGNFLVYLRALTVAQERIKESPFAVVDVEAGLVAALRDAGRDETTLPWVSKLVGREWLGVQVWNQNANDNDVVSRLSFLTSANFYTVEEYLTAITVAATPMPRVVAPEYRDPRALSRAITNFDITCELVLKTPLITKPAIDRTALFAQDAATDAEFREGLSALGELLGGFSVPGKSPSHAVGRLLDHLAQALPNIDQAQVQRAIDLFDAVRDLRNSSQHRKPSEKLIQACERLGLPFMQRDSKQAWDIVRGQMTDAFTILQEEIYAARP